MRSGFFRTCIFNIRLPLTLAFVVFVLTSGCYSYKPPPPVTAEDVLSGVSDSEKCTFPKSCKILTLEQACELALENNPDFISKHHAMAAAWARYYQSLSDYLPTVTGSYNLGWTYSNPSGQHNTQLWQYQFFQQQMQVSAEWLLFDGLMRTMNMLAEKHKAKKSETDEEDARRLLLKSVALQYNDLLLAIEKNRIARTDMEFQQKMLNETQLKYDAGAVPLSDVLNFKIKVNDAESYQITAQYEYNVAKYTLAALMGLNEGTVPDNVKFPSMSDSLGQELADVSVYIDAALNNRPDLQGYRESLETAKYTLYARWGAFFPRVTANTSYTYQRNNYAYKSRNGARYQGSTSYGSRTNARQFFVGGTATWTFFQGGYRIARVREAQALVAEAEFQLANTWISVVQDVRSSYDNYIQNTKQAILYKKTLGLVTKQRDLVEEEYKAGNTELTRLNEAQTELVKADTNLVSALINVQKAKAKLEAATNSNRLGAKLPED